MCRCTVIVIYSGSVRGGIFPPEGEFSEDRTRPLKSDMAETNSYRLPLNGLSSHRDSIPSHRFSERDDPIHDLRTRLHNVSQLNVGTRDTDREEMSNSQ
jgi:hypothetical protein